MITVIAPHARSEFTENLLANFRRQRAVEAQLLVVENGAAVGAVSAEDATVICSDAHQADAMNAGLMWLRAHGGGPWARWDDDDHYGPDYLAGVAASLAGGGGGVVVSGMPFRFVMFDEGLHLFQGDGSGGYYGAASSDPCGSFNFTGGSLAASTAYVAPFERFRDDDMRWCSAMRKRGARFVEREPWGYCYDRTTRSAPRVIAGGSAVTRFSFGASLFFGPQPMGAVDSPGIEPLCAKPEPSDEELVAELSTP